MSLVSSKMVGQILKMCFRFMASHFLFVVTFVDDGIVQLMLCISYYIKNLVEFNGKRKKKDIFVQCY